VRGPGRSIGGFHLRDALDQVTKRLPGIIQRFGGHAFAAGLTIEEAALPEFSAAFEEIARALLTPAHLRRAVETDGPLAPGELTVELARTLGERVWGHGFAAPTFDDRFVVSTQRIVGDKHMKLSLERGGERFDAIAFNQTGPLPARIHAAYRPDVNEWNGLQSLQLVIEHWNPGE
jgi:single-stranded-DNA-specific exonuclease